MSVRLSKFILLLLFLSKLLPFTVPNKRPVRIVKGQPCHIDDYPYLVAIRSESWSNKTYCGGTLINDHWVLTAAHCVLNQSTGPYVIVKYFKVYGQTGKSDIKSLFYGDYKRKTNDNDIALLQLWEPIEVNEYSKLPSKSYAFKEISNKYLDCRSMGWESQNPSLTVDNFVNLGKSLDHLMCAELPIMNHERCRRAFKTINYTVTINHVCAVSWKGQDTCQGDSGGPLVCDGVQVGIISAGLGCGILGVPSFYLRVDHYLDWINETIRTKESEDEFWKRSWDISGTVALKSNKLLLMVFVGCFLILR